jgi:hypothetical protein
MAFEDQPWFQIHADLDTICINGKEGIHHNVENLVMQMEVPYKRLSPHPEVIDMNSQSYNGGTTVAQYIDRCHL